MLFSVSLLVVGAAAGQVSWPAHDEKASDTQPSIELRLAPPARPIPEVAAEIAVLESTRSSAEEAGFRKLQAAYNRALQDAKARIGSVVARAVETATTGDASRGGGDSTSFLQAKRGATAGQPSVRVTVLPASPPDPTLKSAIDAIEEKRSALEVQLLDQAAVEMSDLTTVVLAELEAQLHARASARAQTALPPNASGPGPVSFMEAEASVASRGSPEGVNVRVGTSDIPYPTVAGLVRDMEYRRDDGEELVRQRVLELFMQLLRAENAMIKDALHRVAVDA